MNQTLEKPAGVSGNMKIVTSIASIALAIETAKRVMININGSGIALGDTNPDELTRIVKQHIYHKLGTMSHGIVVHSEGKDV